MTLLLCLNPICIHLVWLVSQQTFAYLQSFASVKTIDMHVCCLITLSCFTSVNSASGNKSMKFSDMLPNHVFAHKIKTCWREVSGAITATT